MSTSMFHVGHWRRSTAALLVCSLAIAAIGQSATAQHAGVAENSDSVLPIRLKQAARQSFEQADLTLARENLVSLCELYRDEHAANPSWRGAYQFSRRLSEVAHEYLRAGQLHDALSVLGEAADLDVPLREGLDNGLATTAAGLHRRLAALDSEQRFGLLYDWSMPTPSRGTVRVLETLVPVVAPPPVFARALGERPRGASFAIADVAEMDGLFSTAWELVSSAHEAGRLRQIMVELEKLTEQQVPHADHLLTLARIVLADRRDADLEGAVRQMLARSPDNWPAAPNETATFQFDNAWQYGYGKYSEGTQRVVDFTSLPHWTGAAWQTQAQRPHLLFEFLRVDRAGGHPGGEQPCIRRWTAPLDGVLLISGTMHHPAEKGDGVRGRLVSSRSGLHGAWIACDGSTDMGSIRIDVRAGETIDFVVDKRDDTYFDTFAWMVQLRLDSERRSLVFDSVADFCGPLEKDVLQDAVIAAACVQHVWLQPLGEAHLAELVRCSYDSDTWINRPFEFRSPRLRPALRRMWATAVCRRDPAASSDLLRQSGLKDWVACSSQTCETDGLGRPYAIWLAHENHLLHLGGPGDDALYFKYPLVGEFEFSFESQTGGRPGTDGCVGYGGIDYAWRSADEQMTVASGNSRQLHPFPRLSSPSEQFSGVYVGQPEFQRFTIAGTDAGVKLRANGRSVYQDTGNARTSPWIALRSSGDCTPMFRNLRIHGNPTILQEVRMSDGESLRGWNEARHPAQPRESPHNEIVARAQQAAERARISNPNHRIPYFLASDSLLAPFALAHTVVGPSTNTSAWLAEAGVITGRRADISHSRICYERPLCNGESVSYEFRYAASQYEVHPALGRLVLLIEPDGVRLHWITDGDRDWTGLPEDNTVVEPFARRGPKPLPLESGDWNQVKLRLQGTRAVLSLNGQAIYEHKLRPGDDCTFGLYYHPRRAAARVRNIVLRGNWPQRLAEDYHLVSREDDARSPADRLAISALFPDEYLADNALAIVRDARQLAADQQYDFLADWVLPGADHATFRLQGAFTPTNPAPPVANELLGEQDLAQAAARGARARVPTGGCAVAPARDLIEAARRMGRLDSLRAVVESASPHGDQVSQRRARLALLILIDIARGDDSAVDSWLSEFCKLALQPPFRAEERWPEMLVFGAALQHGATRQLAAETLYTLTEREIRNSHGTGSEVFDRHLLALTGGRTNDGNTTPTDDGGAGSLLQQWTPVSKVTASSRGRGMPPAQWRVAGTGVFNRSGHDQDFLYFQSPLRGNYEIDCQITTFGWRETQLLVGGRWVAPIWNMKQFEFGNLVRTLQQRVLDPPMAGRHDPYIHYRVAVQDNTAATFFNGRQVHQVELNKDHDPWLAIRSPHNCHGGVRDLRITGTPVIPDQLQMLHDADLTGWLPYYDEAPGDQWLFSNGELVGVKHETGSEYQESLLYYHRPMLEDGSIQYEFFYRPGASYVHPALDRMVLLLDVDGVRVHWCTDGICDRTGLSRGNAFDEADRRRGPNPMPLISGEWNRVKLTLAGNTIKLHLNSELVYERELELSNMRQFGLFHYADRTLARIRNVTWRGNWPKQLPDLADQELADVSLLAELNAKLSRMEVFEHDFGSSGVSDEVFKFTEDAWREVASSVFVHRPDGMHVTRLGEVPDRWHEYIVKPRLALVGDFDVTANFDQLQATRPATGKYAGVALAIRLASDPRTVLWLHRRHATDEQFVSATFQIPLPDGSIRWDFTKEPNESTGGTLRVARRGKRIYFLYADGQSTQFRLHREEEFSDAPVEMDGVWLFLQTGGVGSSSVVWKNIKVWADKISPNPAEIKGRREEAVAVLKHQLTGPLPQAGLEFDGARSHVVIPTLNYDGSYPITYESFVTPDALNNSVIVGDTQSSGASLALNNAFNLHAWNGSNYQVAYSDRPATLGLRVHVAATLQDAQLRIFVNGRQQAVSARLNGDRFVASSLPMVVGASPSPSEQGFDAPFEGIIDSVRISRGARYTRDFQPPTELTADQDTIVCFRFDERNGVKAADSSTNRHDGIIKDAKWVGEEAFRSRAARGLVESGPAGIEVLMSALRSERPTVRLVTIEALGLAGEAASPAMPMLEQLTKDQDQQIRVAADGALTRIKGSILLRSLRQLVE